MGFFSNDNETLAELGNITLTTTGVSQRTKYKTRRVPLHQINEVDVVSAGGGGRGWSVVGVVLMFYIWLGMGISNAVYMVVLSIISLFLTKGKGYLIIITTNNGDTTKFYISGYSRSRIEDFADEVVAASNGES